MTTGFSLRFNLDRPGLVPFLVYSVGRTPPIQVIWKDDGKDQYVKEPRGDMSRNVKICIS